MINYLQLIETGILCYHEKENEEYYPRLIVGDVALVAEFKRIVQLPKSGFADKYLSKELKLDSIYNIRFIT